MVTKKTNFFSSTVLVIKVGSVIITFEIHLNGAIDVRRWGSFLEPWRLTLEQRRFIPEYGEWRFILQPWKLILEPLWFILLRGVGAHLQPWNQEVSSWSYGANPGAMEANPGVIEDPQEQWRLTRNLWVSSCIHEYYSRAKEAHPWTIEAHSGAMEAHLEAIEAHMES
jgi:hypothetical protein